MTSLRADVTDRNYVLLSSIVKSSLHVNWSFTPERQRKNQTDDDTGFILTNTNQQ